uniref:No apical meristem-associated C-terminal domain-containing protein n=1 Tax=Hordeum vulgare subsp. vulgare TaxID=112509 RepID=A0A8I6XTG3_HORVV
MNKKGKIKKGRPFTLPRWYEELKDDEKWKKHDDIDDVDESNKRNRTIELDHDEEEESSDVGKRSPTPNSVSYSKPKRPDGCKNDAKEKKKRKGDDELKNAMEAIVKARKEANEVRKMARTQDAAAGERRLAAEERRVAAEDRKVTLDDRKVGMEERSRLLEWEKHLFFLDTSTLNEVQKEYVNLTREEVLIQKRAMIRGMGGPGIGGMSGFGVTMGGMGAMGGFGATMGGFGAIMRS